MRRDLEGGCWKLCAQTIRSEPRRSASVLCGEGRADEEGFLNAGILEEGGYEATIWRDRDCDRGNCARIRGMRDRTREERRRNNGSRHQDGERVRGGRGREDDGGAEGDHLGSRRRVFRLQSAIRPDEAEVLRKNAGIIKGNPSWGQITLEGNTDERGSEEYNLALGERRAMSVKRYLVDLGVDEKRLRTVSFGEAKPAVPGHDETAWRYNRRVDFAK